MTLNTDQLAALKTAINAETDQNVVDALALENFPAIADFYNADSNPEFTVWKSATLVDDIFNAIAWKKLTPEDTPDDSVLFTNVALACQGRQFNVQTMLVGRETIHSGDNSIRQGFQDALTDVPSGAIVGGVAATQAAGWNAVKIAMQRTASRAEALLASGDGINGTANLVFEGTLSFQDVQAAVNS